MEGGKPPGASPAASSGAASGTNRKQKPATSPAADAARLAFARERLHQEFPPKLAGRIASSVALRPALERDVDVVILRFRQLEEALGSAMATAIVHNAPYVLKCSAEKLLANRLELQHLLGKEGVGEADLDAAIAGNGKLFCDNKPAAVLEKVRKVVLQTGRPVNQVVKDRKYINQLVRLPVGTDFGRIDHLVNLLGCTAGKAQQMVLHQPALSYKSEGELQHRFYNGMTIFHIDAHGAARLFRGEPTLLNFTPDGLARRVSFVMDYCTAAVYDSGVQKWRDQLRHLSAFSRARLVNSSTDVINRLRLVPTLAPHLRSRSLMSIVKMTKGQWNALQVPQKPASNMCSQQQAS